MGWVWDGIAGWHRGCICLFVYLSVWVSFWVSFFDLPDVCGIIILVVYTVVNAFFPQHGSKISPGVSFSYAH